MSYTITASNAVHAEGFGPHETHHRNTELEARVFADELQPFPNTRIVITREHNGQTVEVHRDTRTGAPKPTPA